MGIRIIPLGGLGEIGMNCMAMEFGPAGSGPIVVVDCGVMFSGESIGVDVIHPDFSYLERHRERLVGLVITHGHEDHIGAVPYLLGRIPMPVYAPRYALGLIRDRMKEHETRLGSQRIELFDTKPRKVFELHLRSHSVEIEPIRVTHSIADATALCFHSNDGRVLHTGDFRLEPNPTDGEHYDEERFRSLGKEGVDLLLSDSTNTDTLGFSASEREVAAALERLIEKAPFRVVLSLFASNVHRLRAIAEIARRNNRYITFAGRSVHTHVRVAQETGYLSLPPGIVVSSDEAETIPRHKLLVIATGSQAEPRAALARLAIDEFPKMRLEEGDTVILSSRVIPGNEPAVMRLIGDLYRRGCIVHFRATDPDIHTTGHAHRDEQRMMLDWVQPRSFLPIHGSRHHLERHAHLAREVGVTNVMVVENGESVMMSQGFLSRDGVERVGKVAVDSSGEVSEETLEDRRALAELGVCACVVLVDTRGRPLIEPMIVSCGLVDDDRETFVHREVRAELFDELTHRTWTTERPSDDDIREVMRLAIRRAFARFIRRKPVAMVMVMRSRERFDSASQALQSRMRR